MSSPEGLTATSRPSRPLFCAGLDTSLGSPFVQERLRLLGGMVAILAGAFYIINIVTFTVGASVPPAWLLLDRSNLCHLGGVALMALVWLLARSRRLSLPVLGALDALAIILVCALWAGMAAGQRADTLFAALLAVAVTVISRAIIVPSSPQRTFWLSALAGLPLLLVSALLVTLPEPHDPQITRDFLAFLYPQSTLLWLAVAVAVATVGSRVIYGLRREVVEATDVGQYTLEARIGSGGMGEVWRARHRMLIRPAAVKLIRRQALGSAPGDPQVLLRRFEREARATAALTSPHTVQLFDFGLTDDGTIYYAMELLDGLDLQTLVERSGPVPAERAVHILLQVCASLEDAHLNGLVHRDIKPANVFLSRLGGERDFVKVLDFGLVKLAGVPKSEESIRLTAAGTASGTPGFMAPEVALGEAEPDLRVDIYAVGCVAFWLLTGKLVFEGKNATRVMFEHAHTPPPRPSTRSELAIPPLLDDLVLECLAKDPQARPQSAATLAARLSASGLASAWTRERAERWWQVNAPGPIAPRSAADILLSQEARPLRVVRAPH